MSVSHEQLLEEKNLKLAILTSIKDLLSDKEVCNLIVK